MKFILQPISDSYNAFGRSLILKSNPDGRNTVMGVIKDHINESGDDLFGVQWLEDVSEIEEETVLSVDGLKVFKHNSVKVEMTATKDTLFTGNQPLTPKNYLTSLLNPKYVATAAFVNYDLYSKYEMYRNAAVQIAKLYKYCPVYRNIITFKDGKPELKSLLDIIFMLSEQDIEDTLMAFSYANKWLITLRNLAERVLEKAPIHEGQDLMTQEQQVESFIQFSKLVASETEELVPDSLLNKIKESAEYKRIVREIKAKGFGISETQQFNALQAAAYLLKNRSNEHVIYNLSDMGAGKTFMTVESVYLMDLKAMHDFHQNDGSATAIQESNAIWLPSKNLIAPKLSVKSSWVDTFKLFYDVEQITESQYKLTITDNGMEYNSFLNVSGFTARSNAVTVDNSLPAPVNNPEYLIIDEIHQLVKRSVTRSRFFASGVIPNDHYFSFILSGTLSNLTTSEWYNYIQLMGVKFGDNQLDTNSANAMKDDIKSQIDSLCDTIHDSADKLSVDQRRRFDPESFEEDQLEINEPRMATRKMELFHSKYSSKILHLMDPKEPLQQSLLKKNYEVRFDFNLSMTPNFELFYQLVGHCSVTAQSTQIAEELFGAQKKQHNADVINVPSSLTNDDIKLLRTLHKITTDYKVYKSVAIATAINNAILNLNDGLGTKTVYDILSHYAASNTRFLAYLSTLDLNLLEKLPDSSLIQQPTLEETPKFKVLQDILSKESAETHLIVVNDFGAMTKLGKALGVDTFTRAQLRNQLDYQDELDAMFAKQHVVIVPQMMIKSSLDLVQANRLIQYQLNTEISDIIQTQNRINRIGQTRETKAYYIATDVLQKNIIDLFLETYKNIRVAHKGIVELFVDMSSQVNVINDYISKAMNNISLEDDEVEAADNIEIAAFQEADDNVEMAAFQPSFTSTGVMDLFGDNVEDKPDDANEPQNDGSDEVFEAEINPNQQNLFTPLEQALEHQLVPLA